MNGHGIAFALAGTAAYNAGFVLEKRALLSLPALDPRHPKHLVRTLFTAPGWLVGFACMGIGLACQVGALFTLPLSVAQPLQSGGVVVLALLSWLVLGERTGPRDRRRIALIVLALILLGLSVDDHGPANMPADPATMIITVVVSAACAIALWQAAGGARVTGPVAAGIATGLFYGIAGLGMKGLSAHLAGEGVAAAPASPYGYLLVAASVCGMAVFQTSLQRFRATALVPTANVSGSGYVILVGSLLFHESLPREPLPLALRVTGLVATAAALAIRPDPQPPPQDRKRPLTLDRHLLTVLACAIDKHALLYFADDQILYNPRLRRLYRIESGIPMMRADLASPVDEPRHRDLVRRAPAEASATLGESVDAVVSTVD